MSDMVRAWLDKAEWLAGQATGGAWEWVPSITTQARHRPAKVSTLVWDGGDAEEAALPHSTADAEFIAHARTALPAATAALREILDLHAPEEFEDPAGQFYCRTCGDWNLCADPLGTEPIWPCPTIQTIQDALGEE